MVVNLTPVHLMALYLVAVHTHGASPTFSSFVSLALMQPGTLTPAMEINTILQQDSITPNTTHVLAHLYI